MINTFKDISGSGFEVLGIQWTHIKPIYAGNSAGVYGLFNNNKVCKLVFSLYTGERFSELPRINKRGWYDLGDGWYREINSFGLCVDAQRYDYARLRGIENPEIEKTHPVLHIDF